jgi:hypothetical protein
MIDTPAVRDFREYVENIPSQRDRILIKLLYLTAAKVSEVTRKTTPYDLEKQSSKPYGQYLTYSFGDYEKQHVLLIKLAVAQRRVKRKNNLPHFKIVALPTLLTYEPWTRDLLVWIRDNEAHRLSFDLTRNRVYSIIRTRLRELDPTIRPLSVRRWRITHLVTRYNFTPYDIAAYTGLTFRTGFSQVDMSEEMGATFLNTLWKQYFPKLLKPIYS